MQSRIKSLSARGEALEPSRAQRAFISWFGVRGVGSIYYLMFAVVHGLEEGVARELIGLTFTVIASSVVIHGITVTPLMAWYNRRYDPAER
jgi:NhaP-type Na+/H+ or K+/H+ antiporter